MFTIYMAGQTCRCTVHGQMVSKNFVAFTISTNQLHEQKDGREGLELVSKMSLKKQNTNFRLE